MLPFDRGVVGELKVTLDDVKKTVGNGRYWPRQAHGLKTGAWTYDGLWMPPHASAVVSTRFYPWGDKIKSTLVLGTDKDAWTTTQQDILKAPSAEEMEYARTHAQPSVAPGAAERKGPLKLDRSPYSALTGYRKPSIGANDRLDVPGKREYASRTISDELSEALDAKWLSAKPDPRANLTTPLSEVRDNFVDPSMNKLRGTSAMPAQQRFLDNVGVFKSTGSSGPPGW